MTTNPTKKWTSGPWKYGETVGGKKRVFDTNGWEVVRTMSQVGLNRRKPEEIAANAHLIAQAPRMYDTLEDILRFLQRSGYDTKLVKSVMAEARGETP